MKVLATALAIAVLAWSTSAQATTPAEQVFNRAAEALKSGDYPAAESGFKQVLRLEPHNISAFGNLGVVYSHTHRYAQAITVYKEVLRASPQDPGILLNLGLAYLKQDDYAHALPFFRQLHANHPESLQATNLLGTCLVFGGKPQEALDLLKPAADQNPDPTTVYLLGVAYARAGQTELGKQVFSNLLNSSQTHAQASFMLGEAYYDSKLFDRSLESYQDVLKADPTFPGAHRELGKVYISLRRNEEAEQELRLAVQQDSQDANATYFLGGLLVQTDRFADGASFLERARSLDPDSWATYLYLGKAKLKLHENDAAVRYLRQSGDMNPEEPTIFYLLAGALRATGREEEAKAALHRVSELHLTSLEADRRSHDAMVAGAR